MAEVYVTLEGDLLREVLQRFGGADHREAVEGVLRLYLGAAPWAPSRRYRACGPEAELAALCAAVNGMIALGYEPHGPVFEAPIGGGAHTGFAQMMLAPAGGAP